MATKNGSSYTTGTTTDSVEIPTASPRFSTMASTNKVSPSDCDNEMTDNRKWYVAPKTGNTYISRTITGRMIMPTANLEFSTTPSTKTGPWAPILQLLVVDRCRSHLANPLWSSSSSKIPNVATEFRRYLSDFHRRNYFRFWRPYQCFRLSVTVVLT